MTGFFGQNFGWLVDNIDTKHDFLIFGVGALVVPTVILAHTVLGQAPRLVLRAYPRRFPESGDVVAIDTSQIAQLDVEPGELPPTMAAWVIREEREGEPLEAFQLEEMEVPEPGAFEVIVRVMAAGVNFNNVWAALGKPVSVFRYHDGGPPHRRLGRVGHRLEGRRGRHALEARRRGRRALQPGLLRGRRGPRPRPAGRAVAADLGLRDDLGLVRAVLQGPGPAAAAQAQARWPGRRPPPTA